MKITCTAWEKQWLITAMKAEDRCPEEFSDHCHKYAECADCLEENIEWTISDKSPAEPEAGDLISREEAMQAIIEYCTLGDGPQYIWSTDAVDAIRNLGKKQEDGITIKTQNE